MALLILRLKKFYKLHCNDSSDFIIIYVLTEMFHVWVHKKFVCPNHGNQFILKEILNIFPILITQILCNSIFLNLKELQGTKKVFAANTKFLKFWIFPPLKCLVHKAGKFKLYFSWTIVITLLLITLIEPVH